METILDHNMTEEERYALIGKSSDERFLHCTGMKTKCTMWG